MTLETNYLLALLGDKELSLYNNKLQEHKEDLNYYLRKLLVNKYFPDHYDWYGELPNLYITYDLYKQQKESISTLIDLLTKHKDKVTPVYLDEEIEVFPYVFDLNNKDTISLWYEVQIKDLIFNITVYLYDFKEFADLDKGKVNIANKPYNVGRYKLNHTSKVYIYDYTTDIFLTVLKTIKDNR